VTSTDRLRSIAKVDTPGYNPPVQLLVCRNSKGKAKAIDQDLFTSDKRSSVITGVKSMKIRRKALKQSVRARSGFNQRPF
jgi:hypothetical protein